MGQRVVLASDGHRVEGCGADGELVNRFLAHLGSRAFSPATVRAYAYDLLNFLRFLAGRNARMADVVAMDLFDYLDWQQRPPSIEGQTVVRLGAARAAMPATMNCPAYSSCSGWPTRRGFSSRAPVMNSAAAVAIFSGKRSS